MTDTRKSILHVRTDGTDLAFEKAVRIGRADECDVCIKNEYVSRVHAEIAWVDGQWWVRDLDSSNGVFVSDQRLQAVPVGKTLTFRLGIAGPIVSLEVEEPEASAAGDKTKIAQYVKHYFGDSKEGQIGEHTMLVRRAAAHVQAQQKWKYWRLIAVLIVLILAAGVYGLYQARQLRMQTATAKNLFYAMKSLEVDIGHLQRIVMDSNNEVGAAEIRKYRVRKEELEQSYNRFLASLKVYDPRLTARQRLILRVARIFGECELDMPRSFEAEVETYIQRWQSTNKLAALVRKAAANKYTARITGEFLSNGLPPQFFYLALQESGFDPYSSGPVTRKGIAKGVWQFIPETAIKYGLRLGPLVDLRRPDPGDDRHDFEKETKAAASYIKDLYYTDAQASGFLVMACYNWGEGKVLPLVRSMPANPRERNFWKLLAKYKDQIPRETYDYVFYIISAAVIGEDPRLFGFAFENPLADLENK